MATIEQFRESLAVNADGQFAAPLDPARVRRSLTEVLTRLKYDRRSKASPSSFVRKFTQTSLIELALNEQALCQSAQYHEPDRTLTLLAAKVASRSKGA